jgi:drug/metabolite transporter (DMT)-like permease
VNAFASYWLIATLAVGWGSVAIIVRLVEAPSAVAASYRVLFAALALVSGLLASGRRQEVLSTARQPAALAMGVALALHWFCFFSALRTTSVASAVLTTTSTPIVLAVLAPLLLRERPSATALAATALGLSGVAIMVGIADPGEVRPMGVALGLAAALLGALIPITGKALGRQRNVATITAVQTTVASIVLLPVALTSGPFVNGRDLGLLALLGVVHTALAFTLYYQALRQLPVQVAGVLGLLEPVSAALLAWLLLGEGISLATAVGGALILTGTALVRPKGA